MSLLALVHVPQDIMPTGLVIFKRGEARRIKPKKSIIKGAMK